MAAPIRVVITGAPGAGKSTLLEALAAQGIVVVRESARDILRAEGGMALRRDDPVGFAHAMFAAEQRAWEVAGERGGLTVFDRGFPDIAGFCRLASQPVPPVIAEACRLRRYEGPVFRAPPWRAIYQRDSERVQSWEEAVASDAAVADAWRAYGYRLVDLPHAAVTGRAAFLRKCLPGASERVER